jgi:hypothetical protein
MEPKSYLLPWVDAKETLILPAIRLKMYKTRRTPVAEAKKTRRPSAVNAVNAIRIGIQPQNQHKGVIRA